MSAATSALPASRSTSDASARATFASFSRFTMLNVPAATPRVNTVSFMSSAVASPVAVPKRASINSRIHA